MENPVGKAMVLTTALTLPLPTLAVFLRFWGRYHYRKPRTSGPLTYGEQAFWVFWSDFTILLSYVTLLILAAILFVDVRWGEGIHTKSLSPFQRKQALLASMYFLYSVFYKWGAGISKMATCFLLMAISTPQMVAFNRASLILALYVLGYSISCSIATVFQCGLDPRANWDHSVNQSHCFYKPPFWFAHGALNIVAIIITGILPWWLFSKINFHRRRFVATLMTVLVAGELILSVVRLYGLYLSSQHLDDISYITTTGIFVSQLEVEFGVTAACIPTVLRILTEWWHSVLFHAFNIERGSFSGSGAHYGSHQLTDLSSSKNRVQRRYSPSPREDAETGSGDSQTTILEKDEVVQIRVEKSYTVSSRSIGTDEERHAYASVPTRVSTYLATASRK